METGANKLGSVGSPLYVDKLELRDVVSVCVTHSVQPVHGQVVSQAVFELSQPPVPHTHTHHWTWHTYT